MRWIIVPPFRGENESDPRGAFLQLRTIDDARKALRMLDGRVGPGGETLHAGLTRPSMVHANQMWRWIHAVEDMEKRASGEGEAFLEDEWGGLGFRFGTGEEEQGDTQGVED